MSFKQATRTVKNVVKGYSDLEIKVRLATCNDTYGPSASLMNEITQCSHNLRDFQLIADILDKRLNDSGKNWRHVYKALTVIHFMLENGPENFVEYQKKNLHVIKTLKEYQYIDDTGHDQGANVRQKSKEVTSLLTDDAKLRELREKRTGTRERLGYDSYGASTAGASGVDDDLARAIAASKEQAASDQERRLQSQEEDDLQRAIELSEKEALQKRLNQRDNLQSSDLIKPQGDIIDFFGSLETPQTVQQNSFGGFDPFQQQRMMAEQEQQRMLMEQQYIQQQMLMQQEALRQQEMARQQEYLRQQEILRQQQMQQQQMQQQQMQQQQAALQSNPFNPFAAPAPQIQPGRTVPSEPLDLASNPNAILDPFASISSKVTNPSGPNTATIGIGSAQSTSNNPFGQSVSPNPAQGKPLVNLDSLGSVAAPSVNKNPFSNTNANRYQLEPKLTQTTLSQLQQQNAAKTSANFVSNGPLSGSSNNSLGYQQQNNQFGGFQSGLPQQGFGGLQNTALANQLTGGAHSQSSYAHQPMQPSMTGTSQFSNSSVGNSFGITLGQGSNNLQQGFNSNGGSAFGQQQVGGPQQNPFASNQSKPFGQPPQQMDFFN